MQPEFGDRPVESATLGMAVDSAILRAAGEMVTLNIYAGSHHSNQPSLVNRGGCLSDSSRQQFIKGFAEHNGIFTPPRSSIAESMATSIFVGPSVPSKFVWLQFPADGVLTRSEEAVPAPRLDVILCTFFIGQKNAHTFVGPQYTTQRVFRSRSSVLA